jgi:UDP-glucose 4-epimerase
VRILITGGCGFIGVNLVRYLLKRDDYEIVILDNFSVGKREYLNEAIRDLPNQNLVQVVKGDIRDRALCEELTKRTDAIVHLAAQAGVIPSIENPFYDCEVNIIGTLNLLYSAVKNKVDRFIFASSNAPLGEQKPPVNEAKIPKPLSPYGASKLACEAYCSAFYGSYGLKTVIFRFSNVYGPYCLHKNSVVAKFIKDGILKGELTIYGDGKQTRDFIHVDDICQAIYLVLNYSGFNQIWGSPFHLGTGKETTILELAELVKSLFDKEIKISFAPPRKGEIIRNYSDISRAKEVLGFKPEVFLEEGVKQVYNWFKTKSIEEIKNVEVLSGSE